MTVEEHINQGIFSIAPPPPPPPPPSPPPYVIYVRFPRLTKHSKPPCKTMTPVLLGSKVICTTNLGWLHKRKRNPKHDIKIETPLPEILQIALAVDWINPVVKLELRDSAYFNKDYANYNKDMETTVATVGDIGQQDCSISDEMHLNGGAFVERVDILVSQNAGKLLFFFGGW